MKKRLAARSNSRRASSDDSGFTMVEMVVAIPIVLLVLGLVFTSIGVTAGLMGQVTKGAGSARVGSSLTDQLSAARNCAEAGTVITAASASTYSEKFAVSFPTPYSCVDGKPWSISFEIKDKAKGKSYYAKKITLVSA